MPPFSVCNVGLEKLSSQRDHERHFKTVAFGRADQLAVHLLHELARDIETEAAAVLTLGVSLAAVELVRDEVYLLRRNTAAEVADIHAQEAIPELVSDLDSSVGVFI